VHVETIRAVVDLRDPQIDEIRQVGGQTTLHDIAINTAERLGAVGSDLIVIASGAVPANCAIRSSGLRDLRAQKRRVPADCGLTDGCASNRIANFENTVSVWTAGQKPSIRGRSKIVK
jgi:hypothetical protein